MVQNFIDEVINDFSKKKDGSLLILAKQNFFPEIGWLSEENPYYVQLLLYFHQWCLLEYKDKSILNEFLDSRKDNLSIDTKRIYTQIKNYDFSIYEVTKIKRENIFLKDLISNKKFPVYFSSTIEMFRVGDIIQARIFPYYDFYVLTEGFLLHPSFMKKEFVKFFKKNKRSSDFTNSMKLKCLEEITRVWLKSKRYNHVDPVKIYKDLHLYEAR